nr:hypothetical protein [Tanacetum cinerariifolium]
MVVPALETAVPPQVPQTQLDPSNENLMV